MDARIALLRYCLDDSLNLPQNAIDIDWKKMMLWAEHQAILGVIFNKIQNESNIKMPRELLLKWLAVSEQIKQRNIQLNKRCVELTKQIESDGFKSCVLKGQGNTSYYPNPYSRTPGDIDIWVLPSNPSPKNEGNINQHIGNVIRYVRKRNPKAKATYHHIDYGEFKGVEVEVHYRPSFLNNLIYNYRLQKWFESHTEIKWKELPERVGDIPVPSWEFNVVFQLSHIYKHVIQGGIGLRQFIDYYYLLKGRTEHTEKTESTLRHLGLWKFAGAVMWVLNEVLGLSEEYLIAPKDEKSGRVLLAEIMNGGDFGQYFSLKSQKIIKADSAVGKNIARLKRDTRLVHCFPSECLWEPVFRWYHFFWRVAHR